MAIMEDNPKPKMPDFMDWLVQSVAERVSKIMLQELHSIVDARMSDHITNIHADQVEGLEKFVNRCIEEGVDSENIKDFEEAVGREFERFIDQGDFKVSADCIEDLDKEIKEVLGSAAFNIDFV